MLLTEGVSDFMLFGKMYWGSGFPCRYLQTYLLLSILQPMKECVYLTALPSFWLPFLVELCTPSWNVVLIDCKIHPHSNFKWQSERNGARGAAGSLFIAINRWTPNLVNSRSRSTFFCHSLLCNSAAKKELKKWIVTFTHLEPAPFPVSSDHLCLDLGFLAGFLVDFLELLDPL